MDKSPPTKPPSDAEKVKKAGSAWLSASVATLAIVPIVFTIVFHAGAAYLSYKKYASLGWAIVDFFFAVFYYPYYAFFLSSDPAPVSAPLMGPTIGGRRRKH